MEAAIYYCNIMDHYHGFSLVYDLAESRTIKLIVLPVKTICCKLLLGE